jgi:AcrR family transcriptional regulator
MKDPNTSASFQALLQTARALFWKHGIRRVTVTEICREAGLSKMTFYRCFKNKEDLAVQVIDDIMTQSQKTYRSIMDQQISFPEKIRQVLELKQKGSTDISEEFIRDIYQYDESGLQDHFEQHRRSSLAEFMQDLKNAQQKGWIRKNIKPEFILFMLENLTGWVTDDRLQSMYPNTQDIIMELTNFFFYGILPAEN